MPLFKMIRVLLVPVFLFSCFAVFAQNKIVSGQVLTATGTPVANATVSVQNTNLGTTTDATGSFSLTVPGNTTSLLISSVGYTPQEVNISNANNVEVTRGSPRKGWQMMNRPYLLASLVPHKEL
jgi:hypothetical protein